MECLSAIALRSSSALANQNVSMDLISQSPSNLSVNQFTPLICMCLYTRRNINTRSQNSFWVQSKMHCFQWGESSEKYQCLISVSIFYERSPSDGWIPSRLRPKRIVRSNIRLSKKTPSSMLLTRLDASLTHQNRPGHTVSQSGTPRTQLLNL